MKRPGRLTVLSAWAALCAVLALLILCPFDSESARIAAVRSRYDGWSGVLRLWLCEDHEGGSLTSWLNNRVSAFEKKHKGVYIQVESVDPAVLANFDEQSAPDLLIFLPGMLTSLNGLLPLDSSTEFRKGLTSVGLREGTRYALPIAMDAYSLVYNRTFLDSLPPDWSTLEPPQPSFSKKDKNIYWLNAPADSAFQSWSAALIALFAGSTEEQLTTEHASAGEGIDLGLPEETVIPTTTHQPDKRLIYNALPRVLPISFRQNPSVYSDFVNGSVSAMPASMHEIRRLQLLDDSGKAPDWDCGLCGSPFCDRIALIAVTNCERTASEDRQTLSRTFAEFLLTEDSQAALTKAHVLPVIDLPPIYASQRGLSALESGLISQTILTVPAFDNSWRAEAAHLADQVAAGTLTPAAT